MSEKMSRNEEDEEDEKESEGHNEKLQHGLVPEKVKNNRKKKKKKKKKKGSRMFSSLRVERLFVSVRFAASPHHLLTS